MRGEREPFSIPRTTQRTWIRADGAAYRIMVRTPDGDPPAAGYPAIYLLDANSSFGTVAETVRLRARGPRRLEEAVIVGIGYEVDQPFEQNRRFYDYTVQASDDELPPRKDDSPWPRTGGADEFLTFLESELKPALARELPIDRAREALFGHSLGGWLALYALFSGRGTFRYYAAGSPSIWWKNRWILDKARKWLAADRDPGDSGLLIGVGELERPHMVEDARLMSELLTAAAVHGPALECHCYAGEDHLSVLLPFIGHAVRGALRSVRLRRDNAEGAAFESGNRT